MRRNKHISKKILLFVFPHKSSKNIAKPNELERCILKLNFQ